MKHETIVTYKHPDGPSIKLNVEEMLMTASDADGKTVFIGIDPLGILKFGRALVLITSGQWGEA